MPLPAFLRRRGRGPGPSTIRPVEGVAALELLAHRLADGLLAGATPSLFRGGGVEVAGLRAYVPGDDVRSVDWRVTARTGRPHVRERVEERSMEVHFVVDRSASLQRSPSGAAETGLRVTAALAATAARSGHPVGLLQVTDRVEAHLPAGEGALHLRRLHASLLHLRPVGKGTRWASALRGLRGSLGPRALVVVVSDFRVAAPDRDETASALASLAGRHELLPVHLRTPDLTDLPPVGMVRIRDPESGRVVVVDSDEPRTREGWRVAAARGDAWRVDLWRGLGVAPVSVDPSGALGPQLATGLARRRGRAA